MMLSKFEFGFGWSSPQQKASQQSVEAPQEAVKELHQPLPQTPQQAPPQQVYREEMPEIQTGKSHPRVPMFNQEPLAWREGAGNTLSRATAWRGSEGKIPAPWSAQNRSSLIMGGIGS